MDVRYIPNGTPGVCIDLSPWDAKTASRHECVLPRPSTEVEFLFANPKA